MEPVHALAASQSLEALRAQGLEHAQASATVARKHELNFQIGELSLLRTTTDFSLGLTGIRENRRAQVALNQLHRDAIRGACTELRSLADAGAPDPANAIAPGGGEKTFESGPAEPDLPRMRERLEEFLAAAKSRHPKLILDEGFLAFNRADTVLASSNGTRFASAQGWYSFTVVFSAKDGARTGSFNYTMGNWRGLEQPLLESFGLAELFRESEAQLDARPVSGKFEGEILLTPHVLRELFEAWFGYLSDAPLISGTSVLKGRLGERVASPLLTLTADPRDPGHSLPEFFTGDGFEAEAMPLLEKGVLGTYLLSLYGANKTGLPRARNSGSRYALAPGTSSRAELQAQVKKGILLSRFSGGRPAANGDFSGVAKNSFYVENGEVVHALGETMISGNLFRLFDSVSGVSREFLNYGNKRLPWLLAGGVTVSGR